MHRIELHTSVGLDPTDQARMEQAGLVGLVVHAEPGPLVDNHEIFVLR